MDLGLAFNTSRQSFKLAPKDRSKKTFHRKRNFYPKIAVIRQNKAVGQCRSTKLGTPGAQDEVGNNFTKILGAPVAEPALL